MSQMESVEDGDTVLVARGQHWIGNRYMVTFIERSIEALEGVGVRTGMSFPARAALSMYLYGLRGRHSRQVFCFFT